MGVFLLRNISANSDTSTVFAKHTNICSILYWSAKTAEMSREKKDLTLQQITLNPTWLLELFLNDSVSASTHLNFLQNSKALLVELF